MGTEILREDDKKKGGGWREWILSERKNKRKNKIYKERREVE